MPLNAEDARTLYSMELEKCSCGHRSCHRYGFTAGMFYQGSGFNKTDAEFILAAVREKIVRDDLIPKAERLRIDNERRQRIKLKGLSHDH